jgi:type IV secretion system protein VirD4
MLSRTIGRETIAYETFGRSQKDGFVPGGDRTLSRTEHIAARNLMDSNEIMKLPPEKLLLMRVGEYPLIVRKLRFYDDNEFKGMFEAS